MTPNRLLLALSLLLTVPWAAQAQESDFEHNRKELSISLFAPNIELAGRANLTANDGTNSESFSERGRVEGRARGGMMEATWRLTPRQRVVGGWYGVRDSDIWNYADEGTFADENGDPVEYEYQGQARLKKDFELYRVSYGYDIIQTERFTTTALVGVYGAKIELQAGNEGYLDTNGDVVDLGAYESFKKTSYAPGVGVAASWRPTERLDVRVGAQGFRTSWGSFHRDGHFLHANTQVGYKLNSNWTAFAGYDWFELELRDRVSGAQEFDGTTYAVEGPVSARLRVHGPTVGVRASF